MVRTNTLPSWRSRSRSFSLMIVSGMLSSRAGYEPRCCFFSDQFQDAVSRSRTNVHCKLQPTSIDAVGKAFDVDGVATAEAARGDEDDKSRYEPATSSSRHSCPSFDTSLPPHAAGLMSSCAACDKYAYSAAPTPLHLTYSCEITGDLAICLTRCRKPARTLAKVRQRSAHERRSSIVATKRNRDPASWSTRR